MLESLPGLFLVVMIAITLLLLPYISDEKATEQRGATEEIRINVKRERE